MLDSTEAALLRSIAMEPDGNAARLVFADWLEENGESPRAEFIRVQCELAATGMPEKRRHALRVRERALLDTHRHEWCEALGLPVEEVGFDRGAIDKLRLSQWDGGKLLDPEYAPRFATLTELDLSGIQLADVGLTAFAKSADFPALRKLILSNNAITDVGATALASATKLPRLGTLYFFQNTINDTGRAALKRSRHFKLANLDLGERADGYCMSPGEAEMARRQYLREHLLPVVAKHFRTYKHLQSAMLCVAQYWADEADDAVHGMLIVSELFEPTLEGVSWGDEKSYVDPNLPNTHIKPKYGEGSSSAVSLWETQWDDNNSAIPLWAAFAPEAGTQEYEYFSEVYAPAVMFYRHGGYDILPMGRPHLDGVRPEWGWEE
jgi:uncharacterized protein (TIGR02996 family)